MTQKQAHYKTIFFDLDGTLLPIDMDEFLKEYFGSLGSYFDTKGYNSEKMLLAVNKGVGAMMEAGEDLNSDSFWRTFEQYSQEKRSTFEPLLLDFYEHDFDKIGELIKPNPYAKKIIETLKDKGYQLFLTTMPLFPSIAVEVRLRWAGIEDPSVFDRITTYDNSHAVKPYLEYFQENINLADGSIEEILMVGNNTREDLACCKLGVDAFLVTDWLLDPDGFDYSQMKHGSLEDFYAFVQNLPELH